MFVGISTSLPDALATITPALRGLPELAVSNALGGVLGQTAFLAVADLSYRRANLEHAAASLPNLIQGGLLLMLLTVVITLFHAPQASIAGVHPGTVALFGIYIYGLRVIAESSRKPMWRPVSTSETRRDEPEERHSDQSARSLWLRFAWLALVLAAAGWGLGASGEAIVSVTGLSESAVGMLLTGLSSSLAELVIAISAVRAGALTLAIGNIIGGNTFDTVLVGAADIAYRDGSVYAAVGAQPPLLAAIAAVATAVVLLGLLRRERRGVANIGVESAVILALPRRGSHPLSWPECGDARLFPFARLHAPAGRVQARAARRPRALRRTRWTPSACSRRTTERWISYSSASSRRAILPSAASSSTP